MEAAHEPAVWHPAHAHARLLPLTRPHSQRGRVPQDGLQQEDEGGAGQLHAQRVLHRLRACLVHQGVSAEFRSVLDSGFSVSSDLERCMHSLKTHWDMFSTIIPGNNQEVPQ